MTYDNVGSRATSRNIAAKTTKADIVWFADADYMFGEGCLDFLSNELDEWPMDVAIVYSRHVRKSREFEQGDELIRRMANDLTVRDVDKKDFFNGLHNRAIGGMQIVPGFLARQFGYLDEPEYAKFHKPNNPFFSKSTKEDVTYRKQLRRRTGRVEKELRVPNIYRIRHSESPFQVHVLS